ncbi:MAG: rod shape-determining protein MreD [candidate division BRC1 bacterium ADurb.Bin183]|nr:MAG: rod shape-determining protein MreD [candidate division BRC1 bacterium ADurb.Bin183]
MKAIKIIIILFFALFMDVFMTAPGLREAFTPPMLTLFVFFAALRWKERAGAAAGFLIGLILSGIYGDRAGLLSCAFAAAGYFAGWVSPFLRESPRPILFFFAFFMLLIIDLLIGVLLTFIGAPHFRLRVGNALTGGLVFSFIYPRLEKFFIPDKHRWYDEKGWS